MPHISTFHIWKRVLETITDCQINGTLTKTLGTWINDAEELIKIDYAVSPCHNWLYTQNETKMWSKYKKDKLVRGNQYYVLDGMVDQFPRITIPVEVIKQHIDYVYLYLRKLQSFTIPTESPNYITNYGTIQDRIDSLNNWMKNTTCNKMSKM
jgi:hypothetical protein